MKSLILGLALLTTGCYRSVTKDSTIGQYVSIIHIVDAPSGKCVELHTGEGVSFQVVDPFECNP